MKNIGNPIESEVKGNFVDSRTIDGVQFDGSTNIKHYAACSTAAATAAKEVAVTGFVLAHGATVDVKFVYGNTAASPTLNVSGTGDIPIKYRNVVISNLDSQSTYRLIYDGSQFVIDGDMSGINTWTLSGGTAIVTNTDLDTLVTAGNYYCETVNIATTLINSPVTSGFTLKVFYGIGTGYINQDLRYYRDGATYTRFKNESNIWSAWHRTDVTEAERTTLTEHTSDTDIHVTTADKTNWSDKYTQAEIDAFLASKANSADVYSKTDIDTHTSDTTIHVTTTEKTGWSDKYTKSETDTKLASYASSSHTHATSKVTTYNPTGNEDLSLPFMSYTNAATGTINDRTLYVNNGFSAITREGTETEKGVGQITLGNNVASGTAGNKFGLLRFFSKGTNFVDIAAPDNPTTSYTVKLPNAGGVISTVEENDSKYIPIVGSSIIKGYSHYITGAGWYRIYQIHTSGLPSFTFNLNISRSWGGKVPESYQLGVTGIGSALYIKTISAAWGSHLITKIRSVSKGIDIKYIDIYCEASAGHQIASNIHGWTEAYEIYKITPIDFEVPEIPDGYISREYTITDGNATKTSSGYMSAEDKVALTNKADSNNTWLLTGGTAIVANTDIDTLTTPGNYYCETQAVTQTLINAPFDVPFTMKIFNGIGTDYINQEAQKYRDGTTTTRYKKSSDVWADWHRTDVTESERTAWNKINAGYELIETITVSDADVTAITRNLETDGVTAYNFSELLVVIVAAVGTATDTITVKVNNGYTIAQFTDIIDTTAKRASVTANVSKNRLMATYTYPSTDSVATQILTMPNNFGNLGMSSITNLDITTTGASSIPIGTQIKIFAIRK